MLVTVWRQQGYRILAISTGARGSALFGALVTYTETRSIIWTASPSVVNYSFQKARVVFNPSLEFGPPVLKAPERHDLLPSDTACPGEAC